MDKKETKKVDKSKLPDHNELLDVVHSALDDFWARVDKRYPNARSGDLSPETVNELEQTATAAVMEWWLTNCAEVEEK